MIRHDFKCSNCKHIFEKIVTPKNIGNVYCPLCGKNAKIVFTCPHTVNTKPWQVMQELMRKEARGEINIEEKDYPYNYNLFKYIYR